MLHGGIRIGEYTLVEKLGSGGFGDVWKAEKRTALDVNWFALKFFRPKEDGIEFDKVGRELAVWKQLRGLPHIISVIELDRFDDYVYVVSDFADGGSLESWLRNNGGRSPNHETAVRIALEILTGLEKLHDKGFVHRDLKPDNVLIMNGTHCLADFGISREIKTHSKATGTAGTLEYMPPEAFEKTPSVTPATDIWAVGVILQRLLTGKLPYPQDDQPSLIAAILMSEPDPMPPEVPERLRAIVSKALKKNRVERFASAAEMRAALAEAIRPTEAPAAKKPSSTIVDEDFDRARKAEAERIRLANERRLELARAEREAQEERARIRREEEIRAMKAAAASSQTTFSEPPIDESGGTRYRRGEKRLPTNPLKTNPLKWIVGVTGGLITLVLVVIGLSSLREPIFRNPALLSEGKIWKNAIGMELVFVPPGDFMMGSDKSDDERPVHRVKIRDGFWMGKYEVTQGQWRAVMGSNPSDFKDCGDNCPVDNVSWNDAVEFIGKLNEKNDGLRYSLPSEAEWEYAARAGTTSDWYGNLGEIAWYSANSGGKTHPVGEKKPNAFGLYDMSGNVREWVQDIYSGNGYVGLPTDGSANVTIGDSTLRVLRGGSWGYFADITRSAIRIRLDPSKRYNFNSFRVLARPR